MGKAVRLSVSLMLAVLMMAFICFLDTTQVSGADNGAAVIKKGTVTEQEIVKNLQSKSVRYLEKMGYTKAQIKTIKNCDLKSLTGKVTYWVSYQDFRSVKVKARNSGKKYWVTKVKTVAKWKWINQPICAFMDIYGVTTSDKFVKDSAKGTITYHQMGDRRLEKKTVTAKISTNNTGRGVYTKFPVGLGYRPNAGFKWKCTNGVLTTNWVADGKINVVGLASNYGHSVLELNPSVSFSAGASISFHPYISTKYGDEAFVRARK